MKSIVDILDSKLTLGFSYFYGLGDDHGYLRRMLYSNPSLEKISAQLKDDIDFIESADEEYFMDDRQLKSFKKLKKHISKASDYVTSLLKKKSRGSKWEKKQIEKEIRSLDKDLRAGLIDQEDHDYAIKMLLKPASDDLGEVKSKFEEIDRAVKQELKKVGFEEENPDEDMEDEGYVMEPEIEFESATYDIDKLVDEDHRRYSFGEYADIYEDVMAQQVALKNKMTTDPVARANNMKAQKIRQDRIKNLITKKKLPPTIKQGDLDKMTDEQLAGLENA